MARPPMCLLVALLAGLAPAATTAAPWRALQAATACPCEVCVGKHNSVADCESFGLDCSSTAGTRPPSRAASSKSPHISIRKPVEQYKPRGNTLNAAA